jgi:predicted TIM-barrel enzyme
MLYIINVNGLDPLKSDPKILQSVTDAIIAALQRDHTVCILPGVLHDVED